MLSVDTSRILDSGEANEEMEKTVPVDSHFFYLVNGLYRLSSPRNY